MPTELYVRLDRIKGVEREFLTARVAIDRLIATVRIEPAVLEPNQGRDLQHADERLEHTYLIRLFAEFEPTLRSFFEARRTSVPKTRDLIDSISAMRNIPLELTVSVHAVREFRNSLVHEQDDVDPVTIALARGRLCRYLSRLPPRW